jgi:putative hemolysin
MNKLIPLFILFPFLAQAELHLRNLPLKMVPCPNHACYISESCLKDKKNCEAMKAYKNPAKGKVGIGGANPGSTVCREHFKGVVNIAQDDQGNEDGICVFKDKSMISLSGVWK